MKRTVDTIIKFIERRTAVCVVLLLALAGFLVYSNVLVNGIFMFDDYDYVLNNQVVRDSLLTNITDPRYVGYLTFKLNELIGGKQEAFGFHLFNVTTHVLNAVMVYFLLTSILTALTEENAGSEDVRWNKAVSGFAALIFAVHPLATQAVSYITQRFTSLSTLFYLIAAWAYITARLKIERKAGKAAYISLYVVAFTAMVLAMKTKEITFTIPIALFLFEFLIFRESALGRKRYLFLLPFLAALALIPLAIFGPDLGLPNTGEGVAEITRKDKIFDLTRRSAYEYFLTQLRVIVRYMRLLVLPVDQAVVYDVKASRSFFDPAVTGSLVCIFALWIFGFWAWLKGFYSDGAKGRCFKVAAIGIAWFFLTLSIESSIIPIKDLMFEHRTYLPSVGFYAAFAALFLLIVKNIMPRRKFGVKVFVLAAAVSVPLGVAAHLRNEIWTDEVLFWDDAVKSAPDKPISYHNRAFAYVKVGQYEKALKDFDKAISYFAGTINSNIDWDRGDLSAYNMSKAYANRGNMLMAMGYWDLGQEDIRRAKEVFFVSAIPDSTPVAERILAKRTSEPASDQVKELYSKGEAFMRQGEYLKTVEMLSKIIELAPGSVPALVNRGNAYTALKEYPKAIADFDKAIELSPDFATAYHNRGLSYASAGDRVNALRDMNRACGFGFKESCDLLVPISRGEAFK